MEIELYGNKLKLENNEIYNYRKINHTSIKMDWIKIKFSLDTHGYLYCKLTNNKIQKRFSFHRLVYLFYNQEWNIFDLSLDIDHKNRNRTDNNIENLRSVSRQVNLWNTKSKGYSFDKSRNKWYVSIMINKKNIYIGRYTTEEEASNAYKIAKLKYHNINV